MQFEDVCIPISTLTHSGNLYFFPARRSSPPKSGGARTPMTNTSVPWILSNLSRTASYFAAFVIISSLAKKWIAFKTTISSEVSKKERATISVYLLYLKQEGSKSVGPTFKAYYWLLWRSGIGLCHVLWSTINQIFSRCWNREWETSERKNTISTHWKTIPCWDPGL